MRLVSYFAFDKIKLKLAQSRIYSDFEPADCTQDQTDNRKTHRSLANKTKTYSSNNVEFEVPTSGRNKLNPDDAGHDQHSA